MKSRTQLLSGGTSTRRVCAGIALFAFATLQLTGCSGGSTANVQNPPAPTGEQSVSVSFQPTPPASVALNASASLTAVVKGDPSNAGVDWSVTCKTSDCGSLSSPHTGSGQAQTYVPPTNMSSNSQSVNIIAFATADHSKNALAVLSVSAFANALNGTYIVQTNGIDPSGNPYQRLGAVTLDGNGGVTGGVQTVNFSNPGTGALSSVTDAISGGSYSVGADGRGTLIINTADALVGQSGMCGSGNSAVPCGVEIFSLVALSSSQALLTKIDDPNIPSPSNESSVGTLNLQTAVAAPTGGLAFIAEGVDINAFAAGSGFASNIAMGGILNISSQNISGTGSVVDIAYNDASGVVTFPMSSVTGTVSAPDPNSFGAVTITLTVTTSAASFPVQFTAYSTDATHFAVIEDDNAFGISAGIALPQGAASGTFSANSSFSGTYVFGLLGQDSQNPPPSLSVAGTFKANGAGSLTQGYIDEFQPQGGFNIQISDSFSSTYSTDPAGTGRVDSLTTFSANGAGPELVFYLTGKGTPALVLDADSEVDLVGPGLGGIASGVAYPLQTPVAFSGQYGVNFTENQNGIEVDGTGEIASSSGTISGVVDQNFSFSPQLSFPLSGDSFQTTALAQRLTGTFEGVPMAYYLVNSNQGYFVEIDGAGTGNLTFGSFSQRLPVCQGCQ